MNSFPERAWQLFPGGSNGEYNIPRELIPVIDHGTGCRVWDTDGREFLDMTMAWGAALVGHAHPKVISAARRQILLGANFAAVNTRAVELAERLKSICPCAEKVRFVTSGSEATLLALRVSRAATGRPKILKFEGAYHGQHPIGVASMVAITDNTNFAADSAGTGASWIERDLLAVPFNDLESLRRAFEMHSGEIAGVIVEPFHRCISPHKDFLPGLREITQKAGTVLIFDEVVTGFRLALGGAQEYYGVRPDLAAYGKALGGGFPIGAVAGKAELMQVVDEARLPGPNYVWSASTAGGNPVSAAAALATLDVLSKRGVYSRLHQAGKNWREAMQRALKNAGEVGQILGDGPLAQFAFSPTPIKDQRSWLGADRARGRAMMLQLLREGVFLNPMGTKLYLSLAHDETVCAEFIGHFTQALEKSRP